jgi:hypothetical protein
LGTAFLVVGGLLVLLGLVGVCLVWTTKPSSYAEGSLVGHVFLIALVCLVVGLILVAVGYWLWG